MTRTKFVAGNWKMNTTKASALSLARAVSSGCLSLGGNIEIGIAPPFVYLDAVAQALGGSRVLLGAQDVFHEPDGAFTGEISLAMLKDLGVRFAIAGHSERRHVIHESGELVARKARAIYAAGLTLILCVGETLGERDAGQTLEVVRHQLRELPGRDQVKDAARLVIAYEPVWAIGTGRNATDAQAQEVHAFIRAELAQSHGRELAELVRIQYGGSVKPQNAAGLMSQPDVDGGLIGGASLQADSFLAIASAAAR
jgi:triosephosphate isomerase (TIM)